MTFRPIDDFNQSSFSPTCPVTHLPKQNPAPGKQPHEIDDFILRGPEILFNDGRGQVSLGFFDVRKQAIQDAATEHLRMVPAAVYTTAVQRANHFRAEYEAARQEVDSLKEQLRAMILGNAEMITETEALRAELDDCYAELYPEHKPEADSDVYDLDDDDLLSLEALAEAEAEAEMS